MSFNKIKKIYQCSVKHGRLVKIGWVAGVVNLKHPTIGEILEIHSGVDSQARVT